MLVFFFLPADTFFACVLCFCYTKLALKQQKVTYNMMITMMRTLFERETTPTHAHTGERPTATTAIRICGRLRKKNTNNSDVVRSVVACARVADAAGCMGVPTDALFSLLVQQTTQQRVRAPAGLLWLCVGGLNVGVP
jgi:hypothetical protein